jgi:serine/threonine protein kinase
MTTPVIPGFADLVEVGHGAHGAVYRARQDQPARMVAIKVLDVALAGPELRRFQENHRQLGLLSRHPNIAPVLASGTTPDGAQYLVMPFYARGSLAAQVWRKGTQPWQTALKIGIRMAGAVQTAHDAGVLHRDLTPGNIMISLDGKVRLTDFALHLGPGRHRVVPTPAYAAPEVVRGGQTSVASDVYSLAATLVSLICGHGPYSRYVGENVVAVMYRALHDSPVNLRRAGVPDEVCDVLEWGLAKDPGQRPPSMTVLGKGLQGLQRRLGLARTLLPLSANPPRPPRRRRLA